jgi:hypothetical protein
VPSWLTTTGGLVGLVAAVVSIATVSIAVKALRETRMTPVRQKQHDVIDQLSRDVAELVSELSAVNMAVQQDDGAPGGHRAATEVARYVERMTTPVVVDAELQKSLEMLKNATIVRQGASPASLVDSVHAFSNLLERLKTAREPFQDKLAELTAVENISRERGQEQEPLRQRNHQAMLAAEEVRERLQYLQRTGLGQLSDGWPLNVMRRFKDRRNGGKR